MIPVALTRGTRLGVYEIVSAIGAGGMGEVFLATDTRLDRRVALKVLPSAFALDDDRRRRFMREARAASGLSHPNVATIYDIGEAGGVSYIAMEYIEGRTLADRIKGRRSRSTTLRSSGARSPTPCTPRTNSIAATGTDFSVGTPMPGAKSDAKPWGLGRLPGRSVITFF